MGAKDATEKLLEDYNDVFADIVNTLLFEGKEIIKSDELENSKDKSQFKTDDDELHEQERDVSKYWTKGRIKIALCGL
ncbi:MAG: transposase, partial [Wujia sp.]